MQGYFRLWKLGSYYLLPAVQVGAEKRENEWEGFWVFVRKERARKGFGFERERVRERKSEKGFQL